ncbi:MAG: M36 family metallopeptidase [Pyrinomonadaceae bacterium]|nr:M36 family metallopeptidase [Pyrinomonadaceae bacterium]
MRLNSLSDSRLKTTAVVSVLALFTALITIPSFFISEAGQKKGDGLVERTKSHEDGLENYDIRTDKKAYRSLAALRSSQGKDASLAADLRDGFVRGEDALKGRVPGLKVEYNTALRIPEVIAPEVIRGRSFLANASGARREDALKGFLRENSDLFGMRDDQVSSLKNIADYTNPDGGLSFVELQQEINGVQVFMGEVKAGFGRNGELVRVINGLAPGIDASNVPSDFGDPADAVAAAAANIGHQLHAEERSPSSFSRDGLKAAFGKGDWATTAEKMYFPTEPGVAVSAWRVLIWQPVNAFYMIVDASTGTILWRKNITEDQTQPATYNVWINPNAMINVADNPFPMTPGPTSPDGSQGTALPRTPVTLVGNEAPYTFNNNGWIDDGVDTTDGNAAEAGLDRDGSGTAPSNGVDANGKPNGSSFRVFDFPINPGVPTNPALNTGDAPLQAGVNPTPCFAAGTSPAMIDFQRAAVANLFYITNRYHDEMYLLGFTEAARNFQHDNFGRGGAAGDRVSAEAQDCSGTNNANFGTPADGARGRMQMYIWTAPTPDFDGDLDADVIIHELTHGLSNRLHGNAGGLSTNMSRGMGEGWSDFYGHSLLSQESDPINAIYTTGAYDTYRLSGVGFNNYYYGIRRFPKAVMSFTGGPNNRPHNPLTFADIDATQINLNDGAYAPAFVGTADQVHNAGEVWSSALWEVRAKYIQRLGWTIGNRRVLQHVTDGMKLAPPAPTFLQERDAIIAAALASGTDADVRDIWAGFAIRGMGASAAVLNPGTGGGTARVTEAFDLPNLVQQPDITVSDAGGNNNGSAEPGEPLSITVPLTNTTGYLATDVTAQIVGGGSANYGSIAHNGTASNVISYTVPSASCGSVITLTINVNSSLGPKSFTRVLRLGVPNTTFTETFDGVTAPAIPSGWTAAPVNGGVNFVTFATGSDSAPNSAYALDPATVGGGTDLTSPSLPISTSAASVTFRNKYDTEAGWDGGALEISIGGGSFTDIVTAGGSFVENGYNGVMGAGGVNNPLAGRNGWTGNSNGYLTTTALLPASANGQTVQLRWRFGADDNTVGTGPNPGWYIDNVSVVGNYTCSYSAGAKARSDFDGDGKTDVSVFRPSNGIWYIAGSTSGFTGYQWGVNGDIPVPADYDEDGKTDIAVYRPGANSVFYLLKSNGFTVSASSWGIGEDIPVVRDYDGDGMPDLALYRPSNNTYYVQQSTGGVYISQYGLPGDIPVAGDFDGDGKADLTVFRNTTWITQKTTGGATFIQWGVDTDKLVPADYDGDGKDDIAVFRPDSGTWWILQSSNGAGSVLQWGLAGDIPVPGDYDGDGKDDIAVYRSGDWWILKSTGGYAVSNFGLAGDIPTPRGYLP